MKLFLKGFAMIVPNVLIIVATIGLSVLGVCDYFGDGGLKKDE